MTRRELKKHSKELIRPNMAILAFITLLFILCNYFVNDTENLLTSICFMILLSFVNIMMANATLQISKGMNPDFKSITNDFVIPALKQIVADLIIYAIAIALSFIISFIFMLNVANNVSLLNNQNYMLIIIYLSFGITILTSILSIFFTFVPFIALEEPELGVFATIKKSFKMLKGHFWQLITLNLSFFWWLVLSVCTLGLALFYVYPYISQAKALFYKQIKNGQLI